VAVLIWSGLIRPVPIIGSVKRFGKEWSWEFGLALLKMPEGCTVTRPTEGEARQAVEDRFNELTAGSSKEETYDRMMKGLRARRHRASQARTVLLDRAVDPDALVGPSPSDFSAEAIPPYREPPWLKNIIPRSSPAATVGR
jgi:hypothetical protein